MKIRIHALIRLLSPLHIAHPNSMRMDDNGNMIYSTKKKYFACTAVQRMSILRPQTIHLQEDELDFDLDATVTTEDIMEKKRTSNPLMSVPVIAANNIAGRLRRHAAKLVLESLASRGEKIGLPAYSVLMCGASTGNPDSDDLTIEEYREASTHPYFGLFGGGPKMLKRRVRVHNALPLSPSIAATRGHLVHPEAEMYAIQDGVRLTMAWGFRRVDDLRDIANIAHAENNIEGFREIFEERQRLILEQKKKLAKKRKGEEEETHSDNEDNSKESTKTYNAIEFVIPGVVFDAIFELDVDSEAQLGLFLASLDSFAQNERMGGFVRNGFGEFILDRVLMVQDGGDPIVIFNNGQLDVSVEDVADPILAWKEAAQHMTAKEINRITGFKK